MISVNGKTIDGQFSFTAEVDRNVHPNVMSISGVLKTTKYLENVHTISNGTLILYDVDIISESFGSEDDHIVYGFTAGSYKYLKKKGGGKNGN